MTSTGPEGEPTARQSRPGPPGNDRSPDRPVVVALGGGHGLAASLRSARTYARELTGIVSVGDDGGSSGRLRAELGIAAPGDVRRCVSALATNSTMLTRSLEYRFAEGPLTGHPIGNLVLAGLVLSSGDFQGAIDELLRLVEADGALYPATTVPVRLLADADEGTITGQVTIERATNIRNLRFDPPAPPIDQRAVTALGRADQVVIGPGSLFTSVLATAVVPGIRDALTATRAQRVFVANVANEKGMARGFGLAAHVDALAEHGVDVDVVVAHATTPTDGVDRVPVHLADVAAADGWGHDPDRLGPALAEVWAQR